MQVSHSAVLFGMFATAVVCYCVLRYLTTSPYPHPHIGIDKSTISGRGVFSYTNFNVGDLIEKCPAIIDKRNNIKGRLKDYYFNASDNKDVAVVIGGYCAIINHSDDPNCHYAVVGDEVVVSAMKPINKGDELTISYGVNYWKSRPHIQKI